MSIKSKKTVQWIFFIVAIFIITLLITPFAFKGKIKEMVTKEISKRVEATVSFRHFGLSFIRHFPNASVSLEDLRIVGKNGFANDTLLDTKEIVLVVNLKSIFSKNGFDIQKINLSDAQISAHVLADGSANWDILPTDTTKSDENKSSNIRLKINDFRIKNANITYQNDSNDIRMEVKRLNSQIKGSLDTNHTKLDTHITIDSINGWSGGSKLVQQLAIQFTATIDAQLDKQRYELQNNSIHINKIPLSLNGWVALNKEDMDVELKLLTEKVDFKSILSLVPTIYSKDFEQLQADGKVEMSGFAKGKIKGEEYPAFGIKLAVENAWFKYPTLPKSVQDIQLLAQVHNDGGTLDNTIIDLSHLSIRIGNQPISTKLHITTPLSDPNFALILNGKLDLNNIKDIYPLDKDILLSGGIAAHINAKGKMSDINKKKYDKVQFKGEVKAENIHTKTPQLPQSISVDNAQIVFDNQVLKLDKTTIKIGKNDLTAQGKIENYIGYALNKTIINGNLNFHSSYFNVTDFMQPSTTTEQQNNSDSLQAIQIPDNINFTLIGGFDKLVYNKMLFTNTNARLDISNGNLNINQMNTDAFDGHMEITGKYATQTTNEKPKLDFDIQMDNVSFSTLFNQVDMLQQIAPIMDKTTGKLNAKFSLNTTLQQNMMPILNSILSQGTLQTKNIGIEKIDVLEQLTQKLNLEKITHIKDIALKFEVKNGKINTQPFDLTIGNYTLQLGGTTGIDKTIAYKGKITMPQSIKLGQFQTIGFNIGGTFQHPNIELDVANTLNNIIETQKENIQNTIDTQKEALKEQRKEAREKAEKLLQEAKTKGNQLIEEARRQGDSIIAKTNNPITKAVAKTAAEQLIKQAQKQADEIYQKAQQKADNTIEKTKK